MKGLSTTEVVTKRSPTQGRVLVRLSDGEEAYMPCHLRTGIVEEELANLAALLECGWRSRVALEETVSFADQRDLLYAIMRETFWKGASREGHYAAHL